METPLTADMREIDFNDTRYDLRCCSPPNILVDDVQGEGFDELGYACYADTDLLVNNSYNKRT